MIGFAQNNTGTTYCVACQPGSFAEQQGSVTCLPWCVCICAFVMRLRFRSPIGKFTQSQAQASCIDCDAGFFADQPGQLQCSPCQPGTFSIKPVNGGPTSYVCHLFEPHAVLQMHAMRSWHLYRHSIPSIMCELRTWLLHQCAWTISLLCLPTWSQHTYTQDKHTHSSLTHLHTHRHV